VIWIVDDVCCGCESNQALIDGQTINDRTKETMPRAGAIFVYDKTLAFDPLMDEERSRLLGIRARRFGDSFPFELFPDRQNAISTKLRVADPEGAFQVNTLEAGGTALQGLKVTARSADDEQSIIFPKLGSEHEVRIIWQINLESKEPVAVVRIREPGRFLTKLDRGTSAQFDLAETNTISLNVKIGDGIRLNTRGNSYAYVIVFRLVDCSEPSIDLRCQYSDSSLTITVEATRPVEATFLVRPSARKDVQFMSGHPSVSRRLSEIAIVVGPPFEPRFFLDICSALTALGDVPLSTRPALGPPQSSFPLVIIGRTDAAGWPIVGRVSEDILQRSIRGIIYIGETSPSVVDECLNSANIEFVGVISESRRKLRRLLRNSPLRGRTFAKGQPLFGRHGQKGVGAMFVQSAAGSWDELDEFFVGVVQTRLSTFSEQFASSWKDHLDARLPALPFCRDLAVSMMLSVSNRHRGRCMRDSGSAELDYDGLLGKRLWLFEDDETIIDDRDDLILDIALRTVAEYLAVLVCGPFGLRELGGFGGKCWRSAASCVASHRRLHRGMVSRRSRKS
jgi:hypothetical protein